VLDKYFKEILNLIFTKLDSQTCSEAFKTRFVRFYHLVSANLESGLGADYFISQVDLLGNNIFTAIYLKIILPISDQLVANDRRVAVISFAKSLGDSTAFAQRYSKGGWRFTCEAMLKLLANPPTITAGDDIIDEADVDDIGFGLGFTPLSTCKRQQARDFPEIQDLSQWVREYLTQANARHNGAIAGYVQERLDDQGKQALAMYMG
jgi:exportin-2 (importin alpha re-exporter)